MGLSDTDRIVNNAPQIQSIRTLDGPYKTTSALSKAVAKVKRALPSSSEKKKAVVKKLLGSFDMKDHQDIVNVAPKTKSSKGLKSEVIDSVKSFYERDDISRISPNMRDCRKFKDPITGTKELKQIRYLMYKLSDAHKLFVQHIQKGKILWVLIWSASIS